MEGANRIVKKDYYAILMVHQTAEQFVIEAAYRRLARKYHPDVSNMPDAPQKIDVNEAYAVLSDPVRRKAYDEEYAKQSLSGARSSHAKTAYDAGASGEPRSTTRTGDRTTESRRGERSPVPPNPAAFGVGPGYYERAIEGVRLWNKRKPRIPEWAKWILRAVCVISGIAILLTTDDSSLEFESLATYAFFSFLVAELPIRVTEAIYDAHLKRTVFNPKYNPHPDGYKKYAIEYAKYETEVTNVYVSRNWLYHSNKFCSGMMSYEVTPKWKAEARGATPCLKCGYFSIRPKILPPPFGRGYLPRVK